ncbi:two component transcriptional regulator, LytTR family [Hymenobacter gelipurpurascens]|uniref:Two component transcriptional regulator, LytTR family n=1 Tax=Hymenobacter gelipurpurascens TaxID=89968 RepID=A0A212UDZ7_9BACT|nr:LytTR family DNA-binding domain-containing protein [Hymenobacter gelipurpurascens]SNC76467.1 two component transcriptional regulator, LytTR family [Hymenobacter gelipurpurascens]
MLRCIAVDDEAYASRLLAAYVQKIPGLEMVATTTNPIEALQWVQEGRADLVFLDIQMPELTGLQFLKICGNRCKVILTTAYPEYALEGFEHDVVDYLLKPIAFDRFLRAVQKAQALVPAAPEPITTTPTTPGNGYLFVKGESKNKFLRVNYADILYAEALGNYLAIHVPGQRLVTYQPLKELAELLPQPPFLRVHKSFLVSLDKITMIDGNTIYVQDKAIPVGETYRESLFRLVRD